MNTIFKHKILTGAMLFGALFFASSCDDSEGLKVTPEVPFADKTMFEVITSDAELTEFVDVLNACGAHCADSLFNHSRVYTVWAPANGTFNKDSLIAEIEAGNRDQVFRCFIEAHIANHLKAANGKLEEDNKILLLNDKVALFTGDYVNGYTFDGQKIDDANIRVWNGILHKIAGPAEYKYNIWEFLKTDARVDSVANFLYAFDVTEFSESQSIIGPIKDGEQTYLDSVFVTTNKFLRPWKGVGILNDEDSVYTVYVPTNEVWKEMLEISEKHFNYNTKITNPTSLTPEMRDSMRHTHSRLNLIKYMTYSNYEQRYVNDPDSIMPAWQGDDWDRPEFLKADVEKNVIFEKELSNGVFKIIDKCPYTIFDLWHDTIKLEAENEKMRTYIASGVDYIHSASKSQINKDSAFIGAEISGNRYFELYSDKAATTVRYKVPNLLSASYNVALIVVPKHITNADAAADLKPHEMQIKITQATGTTTATIANHKDVHNDPTRLDTIFLTESSGERSVVTIPYCEYYNTGNEPDYGVVIEVKSDGNTKKYDRSIRLDAILFIPVEDPVE